MNTEDGNHKLSVSSMEDMSEEIKVEINENSVLKVNQIRADSSVHEMPEEESKNDKRKTSFIENKKSKIQLTWKNVTITAPPKKRLCCKQSPDAKEFIILDNVSGTVKPGQFLAIIGASGAGKTTLLNYLSDKDPSRNLKKHGEVYINGIDRDKLNYKKYVAYVQQDDVLSQCLTVKECLDFAAKMKLHPSVNIKERIDMIINGLKLENVIPFYQFNTATLRINI